MRVNRHLKKHIPFKHSFKVIRLLAPRERRSFLLVLGASLLMGIIEIAGVGSIMPFIAVAANPETIFTTPPLKAAYEFFGFTGTRWFLAALGVISQGFQLDPSNPPASVFQLAVGNVGYKIFGVVMWAAAISSVIGAAYTSVSFIRSFSPMIENNYRWFVIAFIVFSTVVFAIVGQPVKTLIVVGTLNGLILPITLLVMIIAAHKKSIVGNYKHPVWMSVFGVIVVLMTAYMGALTVINQLPKLFM